MPVVANMEHLLSAAPPTRRPWGLLVDAATRLTDQEMTFGRANRTGMGATWVPWGCRALTRGKAGCDVTEVLDESSFDFDEDKDDVPEGYPDVEVQAPFMLLDALRCSSLSMSPAELTARLQRRVEVFTSSLLARELIDGAASGGLALSNQADILAAQFPGVDGVFAALEAHLADVLHGAQGIVHIPPAILHVAKEHGYVAQGPDGLRTPTGHLVSADAGHDGSVGPGSGSGTAYWLYATGPVGYHVSSPDLLEGNTFDISINRLERFIEANALVVFDPCAVGAVLLDMAPDD